jgi:serine phosphatase RsbU (regulator of sigma subunit)
MATLIYLVFDPATRRLRFANAGHPPVLVIANGDSHYLADGLAPPIGVWSDEGYPEEGAHLAGDATLLLYTDGLIERRGESIQDGLDRLRAVAGNGAGDLERLCDHRVASLVGHEAVADDVALVALRPSDQ